MKPNARQRPPHNAMTFGARRPGAPLHRIACRDASGRAIDRNEANRLAALEPWGKRSTLISRDERWWTYQERSGR